MTIHVEAHHIRKGRREDCEYCPVALAIKNSVAEIRR